MKVNSEISFDLENLTKHKIKYDSIIKKIKLIPNPYIGNKKKLLSFFCHIIDKYNIDFKTFLDAFCGSSIISLLMKELDKKVISNDILTSSYSQSVALLNNVIKLSNEEIDYILNNFNKNSTKFVENNWSVKECVSDSYRKFTLNEAAQLDNMRANIKDLSNDILKSIALTAIKLVCMKLPFGFIDRSIDIYNHRRKQIGAYGKGSKNHDRRIGIYYDSNMDLNFKEWFPKYVIKLQSFSSSFNNKCVSTNLDIIKLLNSNVEADCIYFDPPYGGSASDYGELYKFFEEYIYEEKIENLNHYQNGMNRFSDKNSYEENFIEMLSSAQKIPLWLISFNDSSWCSIEKIMSIVRNFRENVCLESKNYEYNYRNKKSKSENEHIIFAS